MKNKSRSFKVNGKIVLLGAVLLYVFISLIIKLDILFFLELPEGIKGMFNSYFPPKFENIASTNNIFKAAIETIIISCASTGVGAVFALLVTLLSINDMKFNIFGYLSKIVSSISRSIPAYIWGLMLIAFLWYGAFVAFIALAIGTFGFLVRAFSEVVNNTGKSSIEALKATGATNWQIIIRAIIPGSLPLLFSWSLYSFESNVRGATIVGLVAKTGLGGLYSEAGSMSFRVFPFKLNYQMAIILSIAILVITIDLMVSKVRERLLKWN